MIKGYCDMYEYMYIYNFYNWIWKNTNDPRKYCDKNIKTCGGVYNSQKEHLRKKLQGSTMFDRVK